MNRWFIWLLVKGNIYGTLGRPQAYSMLLMSHWLESSHVSQNFFKCCWEISFHVPTCPGRRNYGEIALHCSCLTWPTFHCSFIVLWGTLEVLFYRYLLSSPKKSDHLLAKEPYLFPRFTVVFYFDCIYWPTSVCILSIFFSEINFTILKYILTDCLSSFTKEVLKIQSRKK